MSRPRHPAPSPGTPFNHFVFRRVAERERWIDGRETWVLDCTRCKTTDHFRSAFAVRNGRRKSCGCLITKDCGKPAIGGKGDDPILSRGELMKKLNICSSREVTLRPLFTPKLEKRRKYQTGYLTSEANRLARCLLTAALLADQGFADPQQDGQLWVVQLVDSKTREMKMVDLCAPADDGSRDTSRRFLLAGAAEQLEISLARLLAAVNREPTAFNYLPTVRIHGRPPDGIRVVSEMAIEAWKRATTPQRVEGTKWKTSTQLADMVKAKTIEERREVAEQIDIWARMTKNPLKSIIRRAETNDGREAVYEATYYDVERFRKLWQLPIDEFVKHARAARDQGMRSKDLRAYFEANGIGTRRRLRIMQLAGADAVGPSKQLVGRREKTKAKRTRRHIEKSIAWLQTQLERDGPLLEHEVIRRARRDGITAHGRYRAFQKLECRCEPIPTLGAGRGKGHPVRFVLLPGQSLPTVHDARRLLAEWEAAHADDWSRLKADAEARRQAGQGREKSQSTPATKDVVGSRSEDDQSDPKRVQWRSEATRQLYKLCYLMREADKSYDQIRDAGNKLLERLGEAPQELTNAAINRNARRYAMRMGLPFTPRS